MATVKAKAGADSATPKQGYQFSDDGAQVTAWDQVNAIRTASDKCAEQVAAAWQIMHSNAPQMTFGSFIELVTKINGKFRGRWGSSDANEHRRAVRMAVVESHNPDGATVGGIKIDLHKLAELAELPFVDEAIEAIEAIGENLSGGDVVEISGFVLDDDGLSVSWDGRGASTSQLIVCRALHRDADRIGDRGKIDAYDVDSDAQRPTAVLRPRADKVYKVADYGVRQTIRPRNLHPRPRIRRAV